MDSEKNITTIAVPSRMQCSRLQFHNFFLFLVEVSQKVDVNLGQLRSSLALELAAHLF